MQSKLIQDRVGERTWAVVFETGEEVVAGLREFAREANLIGSHFTAIGAFSDVVLGFFDPVAKKYEKIPIPEQVEVLSLLGNVALHHDKPKIHAHVVVGKRDGTAHGGHLMEAHVRPTLEVIVVESPRHLERQTDDRTGLALLKAE
ncbi:MAG: DNA-binding protein [Planctomycetia bacterium]|nr:DNA-binding protein [Planctomycetia bacterium]